MEATVLLRLLVAGVLGGAVGLERENHGRPAGLRTHVLVSLGACLIMIVGAYSFPQPGRDPFRLAAQIVSGIGFLGAGTILREGTSVKGLTTAASLWVVAGVGIAVGAGAYFAAGTCTLLVVGSLIALSALESKLPYHARINVTLREGNNCVERVLSTLGEAGIRSGAVSVSSDGCNRVVHIKTEAMGPAKHARALGVLASMEEVLRADVASVPGNTPALRTNPHD